MSRTRSPRARLRVDVAALLLTEAGPTDETLAEHTAVVAIQRTGARLDRAIGRTLQRFKAIGGHHALGFARFSDYVRESLGQSARWADGAVRAARVLDAFPKVAAAHAEGRITTSHVLALAPVLTSGTERAWIACAEVHGVRDVAELVRESRGCGRRGPRTHADLVEAEASEDPRGAARPFRPNLDVEAPVTFDIPVPAPLRELFEYAIELTRRLVGEAIPVDACVDHMLAEYAAAFGEDVAWTEPPRPRTPEEEAERLAWFARIRERFGGPPAEAPLPKRQLHRLPPLPGALAPPAEPPPDPVQLDAHARRLLTARHTKNAVLAELLARVRRGRALLELDVPSFDAYCRDYADVSPRSARELEHVRYELRALPAVREAFHAGSVSWAKVRLLARVATGATEAAWLARARAVTVRYLERDVRDACLRREVGDRDPAPRPIHHLPPYAADSPVRPGAGLWERHTSARGGGPPRPVPLPSRVRLVLPWSVFVRWCDVETHLAKRMGADSEPWHRLLALLEHFLGEWDRRPLASFGAGSAVHARFGWMCAVPGCSARRNLEQHHIQFRSQGGGDDPANLVTLCAHHHRVALHERGRLSVEGRAPDALRWSLPVGRFRGDVRQTEPGPGACTQSAPARG